MAGGNRYKHRSLGGGLVPNQQQAPSNNFYVAPPPEPSMLEKALQLAQGIGDASSEYVGKANADIGNRLSPFGPVPTQFVKDTGKHLLDSKFGLVPAGKAIDDTKTLIEILQGKGSTPFASVQGQQVAGDAANNAAVAAMDASTLIPGMGVVPKMGRAKPNFSMSDFDASMNRINRLQREIDIEDGVLAPTAANRSGFQVINGGQPTLGMGFPFGGKDGEKPLSRALMDMFKGKPKESPLDQFAPPKSLDDIFTGGSPRGPREITGGAENPAGMESSFFNDPRFNGPQEAVPYDPAKGFQGLDARLGKKQPLVGYRGLRKPYDETTAAKMAQDGKAQWFSETPDTANSYIMNDRGLTNEGANVVRANLQFRNPLEIDAGGKSWQDIDPGELARKAKASNNDGVIIRNFRDHAKIGMANTSKPTTIYGALDPQGNIQFPDAKFAADKNARTLSEALAKAKREGASDSDLLALLLSYGAASGMGASLWADQAQQQQPGM